LKVFEALAKLQQPTGLPSNLSIELADSNYGES